jgi:FkbM family methyltransferase
MNSFSLPDCKGVPIDKKLDKLFSGKENGFFIELGANDGLNQSNTAFFEFYRGWKGILIEPSVNAYEKCVQARPNSKCFNYACVSDSFTGDSICGDFNGHLMSSVDGTRLNNSPLTEVKVITLEKLLEQNNATTIDLLSLDTEGYELDILKGLNLKRFRPKLMIIEVYTKDFCDLVCYLAEHNYRLFENISNYNKIDHPTWDGTHNDYVFYDATQMNLLKV